MGNRRLINLDWLETTFERSIFFEVLAVFVESGCTNGLQFTTSQHGLENACSVNGAFSSTSTNESMNFVDEQNDVATGLDFFENFLQALFEVTAVTATCNE